MKSIKDAADDPSTLVDRLRGVYPIYYPNSGPTYKSPPIQHEAAREIERLREVEDAAKEVVRVLKIASSVEDAIYARTIIVNALFRINKKPVNEPTNP